MSIDSLWKVGVKRGWWKSVRNGDVWVFVIALGIINAIYEINSSAVRGGVVRRGLGMLNGEGWVDRVGEMELQRQELREKEEKGERGEKR